MTRVRWSNRLRAWVSKDGRVIITEQHIAAGIYSLNFEPKEKFK